MFRVVLPLDRFFSRHCRAVNHVVGHDINWRLPFAFRGNRVAGVPLARTFKKVTLLRGIRKGKKFGSLGSFLSSSSRNEFLSLECVVNLDEALFC